MHQIITKSNQNICCLPIIDIEEKFKENSAVNTLVQDTKSTINSPEEDRKVTILERKNETFELNDKSTILEEKQSFIPKAFVCFCGDDKQSGSQNKIGVTFAQEAKNYRSERQEAENIFKKTHKDIQRKKIYVRNLDTYKSIPVVSSGISGSRYIYDNNSLLDYCMKWCKSVYFGRVVLRAIHNTGTLLLIFPGKAMHFVQFLYGKSGTTEAQRKFQSDIFPVNVLEFHSFVSFSNWMKKQMALDS